MKTSDILAKQFESLATTDGIAERALEDNPELIKILKEVIEKVEKASKTKGLSPIRFLEKQRDASRQGK
jgi:hypothetical protein